MAYQYDLEGALAAGNTPAEIIDVLAAARGYNLEGARAAGNNDSEILSTLMGYDASDAFGKRLVYSAASTVKGIGQLLGLADTSQLRGQKGAADIASTTSPIAGGVGSLTGAVIDPVGLVAYPTRIGQGIAVVDDVAKGLWAATRGGAAQGAIIGGQAGALEGFLAPVLEEGANTGLFSLDRLKSAGVGAAGGVVLGGGLGGAVSAFMNRATRKTSAEAKIDSEEAIQAVADAVAPVRKESIDASRPLEDNIQAALNRRVEPLDAPPSRYEPQAKSLEDNIQAAVNRRIEPVDAPIATRSLEQKLASLETDVVKAEERLATLTAPEPIKTASLLRSTPAAETPQSIGLVETTPAPPVRQTAALFQPSPSLTPPPLRQGAKQTAALTNQEAYLRNIITTKQQEAANIQKLLTRPQDTFSNPSLAQQAARDVRVASALERGGHLSPPVQPLREAPISSAPLSPSPQTKTASDVWNEVQQAHGQKSLSAAGVHPYISTQSIHEANAGRLLDAKPPIASVGKVAPVSTDPAANLLHGQVLSTIHHKTLKALQGLSGGDASLASTYRLGREAEQRLIEEHGSMFEFAMQNAHKSWNREELSAFFPYYLEAQQYLQKVMPEWSQLKAAGKLTEDLKQQYAANMQLPIALTTIFQGQRSRASSQLNAFKLAKETLDDGKMLKGLVNPGTACM